MHGEMCALCASVLWSVRDGDVSDGADEQELWVMWSAATRCQLGSSLM